MDNLNILLDTAIKRCSGDTIFDEAEKVGFNKIYPFTTESINGYINVFDLQNKSLLTVGSSGDQAINAAIKGCKDITILDINPYTRFYYYLKLCCIIELSYDDFFKFLCPTAYQKFYRVNNDLFDKNVFNKIKETLKLLDYNSYLFWNELFETYKPNEINRLFTNDVYSPNTIKECNLYLSSWIEFNEIKNIIKNININFEIKDIFKANFNKLFDNIWLSNIAKYLNYDEIKNMVDNFSSYLNDNGMLIISYLYGINSNFTNDMLIDIYNLDKIYDILCKYNPYLYSFKGVSNLKEDSILIHKKH